MNDDVRKEIANALTGFDNDSITQLKNAIDSNNNPATGNSLPMFRWDVRYSKIKKIGIENNLKVIVIKRGNLWELVVLMDEETKEISLFMSEKNLKKVINKNSPTHYMSILSYANKDEPLQMSLNMADNQHKGLTEELFVEMMNEYEIDVKKTFVYSFSNTYGQEQFLMYRFDSDYNLIEHKNLSGLIDSNFETTTNDKVVIESKDSTTVNKLKKQEKQIVSLKK